MIDSTSAQSREAYRERLYQHYVATHFGIESVDVNSRVQEAYPYFKRVLRHIPEDKNTRILDLGCGCGSYLYLLAKEGYLSLEGVDRSPEQVASARRLGLECVKAGNILVHLSEREPGSCDVVMAFDVIEHLGKEEALQFADRVFRVLAPGGLFILHLPNGEGFLSGSVAHGDFTHEILLTSTSLGQLLRCSGFSEIRSYEDTPVVHGFLSAARYAVWKAARIVLRIVHAAQTGDTGSELILTPNFLAVARKS
jgi:2-polyprenyl-3-methyl-5-hydroxy-6-metoxy-1,4-benzoquinol methylase